MKRSKRYSNWSKQFGDVWPKAESEVSITESRNDEKPVNFILEEVRVFIHARIETQRTMMEEFKKNKMRDFYYKSKGEVKAYSEVLKVLSVLERENG